MVISGRMSDLESTLICACREFCPVIPLLKETRNPVPWGLSALGVYEENATLREALERVPVDTAELHQAFSVLVDEGHPVDPSLREAAGTAVVRLLRQVAGAPEDPGLLRETGDLLELMERAGLHPDLWNAQNLYLRVLSAEFSGTGQRVSEEDFAARKVAFERIGDLIGVTPGG
jgi:hypothetical protein